MLARGHRLRRCQPIADAPPPPPEARKPRLGCFARGCPLEESDPLPSQHGVIWILGFGFRRTAARGNHGISIAPPGAGLFLSRRVSGS